MRGTVEVLGDETGPALDPKHWKALRE